MAADQNSSLECDYFVDYLKKRNIEHKELSIDEIKEVILQSAIYAGVPAANSAFHWAQDVFRNL